jgi:hypothetical protein
MREALVCEKSIMVFSWSCQGILATNLGGNWEKWGEAQIPGGIAPERPPTASLARSMAGNGRALLLYSAHWVKDSQIHKDSHPGNYLSTSAIVLFCKANSRHARNDGHRSKSTANRLRKRECQPLALNQQGSW